MTEAVTVSQLNQYVAELLNIDENLHGIRVKGEISGFKKHSSGHLYFSLKDATSLVRCVMFRQQAMRLSFTPEDGMQVTLTGYASLYVRDGAFQLYAQNLEKQGEGELYAKFLALKEKLEGEGYFDAGKKKSLPYLPERVGVVTSETGAALQDILQIVGRRFPGMPVVIAPAAVQGEGAAHEIAQGIRTLNRLHACDVMIVGRGGGAYEDLWAFNEMDVAQAIFDSDIPVISAVGHEIDFTIADFVADMRAPTPSAAAELAVPEREGIWAALTDDQNRLNRGLTGALDGARSRVRLAQASRGFTRVEHEIDARRQTLDGIDQTIRRLAGDRVKTARATVDTCKGRVGALSPTQVLKRGYAVLADGEGTAITSAGTLQTGQTVQMLLYDGSAEAEITKVGKPICWKK